MNELPQRKPNRLRNYDYADNGTYFITICTAGKRCILSEIHAIMSFDQPYELRLSNEGIAVEESIKQIEKIYSNISVEKYVIMPNHIHMLLLVGINADNRNGGPSIQTVIAQFKRSVSLKLGHSVWQKGFYDHVIRGRSDYEKHWSYIDANPVKWVEDQYYTPV